MFGALKLYSQRWMAWHVRPASTARRKLSDPGSLDGATFDHSDWDAVLAAHVRPTETVDGVVTATVDYAGVSADPRFDSYVSKLANADLQALAPAEHLALLLNAYNALCVGLVVEHERRHPGQRLSSITALDGGASGKKVWDQPAGVVGGKTVSLGQLEHRELRGGWDEPRLHFCIVCASASCPDLRGSAYVGERLQEQMADQAATFFANPTKGLAWDGTSLTLSYAGRLSTARF